MPGMLYTAWMVLGGRAAMSPVCSRYWFSSLSIRAVPSTIRMSSI